MISYQHAHPSHTVKIPQRNSAVAARVLQIWCIPSSQTMIWQLNYMMTVRPLHLVERYKWVQQLKLHKLSFKLQYVWNNQENSSARLSYLVIQLNCKTLLQLQLQNEWSLHLSSSMCMFFNILKQSGNSMCHLF